MLDRGGGDISGSILAKCLGADLYENWTDVSGLLFCRSAYCSRGSAYCAVTYEELRELSTWAQASCTRRPCSPVREAGIPLVIKNTNAPQDPGTIISETADEGRRQSPSLPA